ncbi:C39 family peptidase [Patescibacteria group bacterium]|nr:C39 family peptidase [Patescibacteria group bacterium]
MRYFLYGFGLVIFAVSWMIFNISHVFIPSLQAPATTQRIIVEENIVTENFQDSLELTTKALEPINLEQTVLLDVPFTSQAPMANWHLDAYQYGCEEASLVMAIYWLKREKLSTEKAEAEIAAMSAFQREQTGNFYDTSVQDTVQLMQDYYGVERINIYSNATADDIKKELLEGNLVIVPINADVIVNPHYTTKVGAHMLVVTGYDAETKEFITNDPGTKRGEGLRYDAESFGQGIRDYVTGRDTPVVEIQKRIIVIEPQEVDIPERTR